MATAISVCFICRAFSKEFPALLAFLHREENALDYRPDGSSIRGEGRRQLIDMRRRAAFCGTYVYERTRRTCKMF